MIHFYESNNMKTGEESVTKFLEHREMWGMPY